VLQQHQVLQPSKTSNGAPRLCPFVQRALSLLHRDKGSSTRIAAEKNSLRLEFPELQALTFGARRRCAPAWVGFFGGLKGRRRKTVVRFSGFAALFQGFDSFFRDGIAISLSIPV
jgi:hypothetical protein